MKGKGVVVLVLVTLLVLGGIIYIAKQKAEKNITLWEGPGGIYRIEKRPFGNTTDYYVHTQVDDEYYVITLRNGPWDVENVSLEKGIEEAINRPKGISWLYVTQDMELPEQTKQMSFIAAMEFGRVLGTNEYGIFKIRTKSAFTSSTNETIKRGIPEKTCYDVDDRHAVIYLKLGEENRVYSDDECVIVEGVDAEGLIKTADKFTYYLLGAF